MTREEMKRRNIIIGDTLRSYPSDLKVLVKDYEILTQQKCEVVTTWKLKEIDKIYDNIVIIYKTVDIMEKYSFKRFFDIPTNLLNKKVLASCIDSLNHSFILYI